MIIETDQGRYRGIDGGIDRFLGIPYALPPVGDQRWRMPQAPRAFSGVCDARTFGADCPQAPSVFTRASAQNEDCLTVNIWTPRAGGAALLPVLLWLPGGGFAGGSGSDARTDGMALAQRGVVVVTVNYRVGIFGYIAHPELTIEGHGCSGKYGLHDAAAALAWVKRNIAQFRGDPDCITLGGVSAGAAQASLLMTSASINPPHQLLMQSPGAMRPLATLQQAEADGAALGMNLDALRALTVTDVLSLCAKTAGKARPLTRSRTLRPIIDGGLIRSDERHAYLSGQFHSAPMLIGTTRHEGMQLAAKLDLPDPPRFHAFLAEQFDNHSDGAAKLYPVNTAEDTRSALAAVYGDTQFNYGAARLAAIASKRNPVWRYLFEFAGDESPGSPAHGDDVPYAFGVEAVVDGIRTRAHSAAGDVVAAIMCDRWTRFIRHGDPGWAAYDEARRAIYAISEQPALRYGWRDEHVAFIDRYFAEKHPSGSANESSRVRRVKS